MDDTADSEDGPVAETGERPASGSERQRHGSAVRSGHLGNRPFGLVGDPLVDQSRPMITDPHRFDPYLPLPPSSLRGSSEPPPLVDGSPGSFAFRVLHDRHPTMIQQVAQAHPFGPDQLEALDQLAVEVSGNKIWALGSPEGQGAGADLGDWYELPFLWTESLFYRKLLNAVGFFAPGPWYWHDPFAFLKNAELAGDSLTQDLDEFNSSTSTSDATRHYLHRALWGNQADLGFAMNSAIADQANSGVIVDHSETIAAGFHDRAWPTVAIVGDNAGRELMADLLLIDHLLHHGHVDTIDLHLKVHPYYVSDATTTDLVATITRLGQAKGRAAETAARLSTALGTGQLRLNTHPFYCGPNSFHHLPDGLTDRLAESSLVVMKGDLNYRRLVGDNHWPATTPFADAVAKLIKGRTSNKEEKQDDERQIHVRLTQIFDTSVQTGCCRYGVSSNQDEHNHYQARCPQFEAKKMLDTKFDGEQPHPQ